MSAASAKDGSSGERTPHDEMTMGDVGTSPLAVGWFSI